MNQSRSILILASLVVLATAFKGVEELPEESDRTRKMLEELTIADGEAIFRCFFTILCDNRTRTAYHIRDVWLETGPKWKAKSLELCNKFVAGMHHVDTPEFWDNYPDFQCVRSEEELRELFKDLVLQATRYYERECANADTEECLLMSRSGVKAFEIEKHYTELGICHKLDESEVKKDVKHAAKAGGVFQNAAKRGVKRVG